MKRGKTKSLTTGYFKSKLFRLLGMETAFKISSRPQQEKACAGVSNDHFNYYRELEKAMLEAEQDKAKAIREWERRRFIC